MNSDGFAVTASSSTWTAADPTATHDQLHGQVCAGDGAAARHATGAVDMGGRSVRSGMCLLVPLGRAGGQRCLEEQEVASERWLWHQGGRDVKRDGDSKDTYFWAMGLSSSTAVAYSGGCCGEQTSLRAGLGTRFPGLQPLEAALLQLLSFHSLG